MTPFDTEAPSSSPRTIVRGLDADPGRVNDVYIRSAAAPSAALHLQYCSLPASRPGFPRTANLWGFWRFPSGGMEHASRIDLWLGGHFSVEQIRQLRRLNPNCLVLTDINTVENNDVPDEYGKAPLERVVKSHQKELTFSGSRFELRPYIVSDPAKPP